ncbi:hypothetical protein KAR91_67210 [Candidatus Pacearchaeota archaeon]|nr:hypothetical protein [Candidatus Pacearchaeota archaeon]
MMLWEGIKNLEVQLKHYSKRFLETSNTLHKQHGWIVSGLYQQEIYRMAVNRMNMSHMEIEPEVLCVTIEHLSFQLGQQVYMRIMRNLEIDQRVFSMKDN